MSRGRQILRQWSVLRALEGARYGLPVRELLEVVEDRCTERTLYRDLHQLVEAGFPLVDDDGRWRVLRQGEGAWSLPIQPTELLALTLAEDLFAPAEGSWLASPIQELRRRLASLLPPAGRKYLAILQRSAMATLFAPARYQGRERQIDALLEALEKEQVLRIVYASPGAEPQARDVEPYTTWYHAGQLYLIAYCHKAQDIRTFAVHRMERAEVLDETFDPDPAFNAAAFARKGFGVYHGPTYHFVIDFDAEVAHIPRERRFHESQRVRERADGAARMTMDAAGLPEVAAWVAGFGGLAVPREPPELLEAVRAKHEDGLRRLGAPT